MAEEEYNKVTVSPPKLEGERGKEESVFRPPLTPPNLGGEKVSLQANTMHAPGVVTSSPPKLGGVRGGLNGGTPLSSRHNHKAQTTLRKSLRNNATAPEAMLWLRLKGKQIEGLKFRRQHGVGPFVLDFYCPELRLGIELDGKVHDTYGAYEYDTTRTRFLNENRILILRYKNEVVYQNIEAIVEDIIRIKEEREKARSDHP